MSASPLQQDAVVDAATVDTRTREERTSEWTPAKTETFGSAHHEYAKLRKENPFPWSDEFGGFWAATTYEDVLRVTQDDNFITSVQNVVPPVPRKSPRPPLHIDPPKHADYRRALDPTFRKSAISRLEGPLKEIATRLVGDLLSSAEPDGARGFASPYAIEAFAAYLGVDPELSAHIRKIGLRYSFAIQEMDDPVIQECSVALYEIAERVYRERTAMDLDPQVDLVAALAKAAEEADGDVTEESAIATIRQLIVAGAPAVQAVLGSCLVHLAEDLDLQAHLRAQPEDLPAAIEEMIRLHAPYRVFARTAKEDAVVSGRLMRAGEAVTILFPSANRDEEVWDSPNEFQLHRPRNSHLSFGRGTHKCPGAAMARLELKIALSTILELTSEFTLAGDVVMMNWLEYGPSSVPLKITPAA